MTWAPKTTTKTSKKIGKCWCHAHQQSIKNFCTRFFILGVLEDNVENLENVNLSKKNLDKIRPI